MSSPDTPYPYAAVRRARVLVVGDVMLDRYWFGDVNRISPEAPVPVVGVKRREDRLGGAANVARNIVSLGAQASLVGILGDDEAGHALDAQAAEAGIAAHWVRDSIPTTLKLRVLGRQQQLLRADFEADPSAEASRAVVEAVTPLLAQHDVLVLSDYAKGALREVQPLIAAAHAAGVAVLVDPKGDDYLRYRGASLISPNQGEMQVAVGRWQDEADLGRRAEVLRETLALEALLVTRSEQGMTLFRAGRRDHVDANAQEVFDVSGAGDTVLATLAVMRAAGLDWVDAMQWANHAAGRVVGKIGTSVVTPQELEP